MGVPLTSRRFSGMSAGPPSIGLPRPSNTRESISDETGSSIERPRNLTFESARLIPAAESKSCTRALVPSTSSTLQRRVSPFGSSISPSSSYLTPSTSLIIIRGPATSRNSFGISHHSFSVRLQFRCRAAPGSSRTQRQPCPQARTCNGRFSLLRAYLRAARCSRRSAEPQEPCRRS